MSNFYDAWTNGTPLERSAVFLTVRPFLVSVLERWLRRYVADTTEKDFEELRRTSLTNHISDGMWIPFEQSDYWSLPGNDGWRLLTKSFGPNFEEYDSFGLLPPVKSQLLCSIKVTMTRSGEGVALKDLYVGIFPRDGYRGSQLLTPETFPLDLPPSVPPATSGVTSGRYPIPYVGVHWTGGASVSEDELIDQAAEAFEAVRSRLAAESNPLPAGQPAQEVRVVSPSSEFKGDRVRQALERQGFRFSSPQIATFYAALKAKGFVLLSGLSGTGKTALAQRFLSMMGVPESHVLMTPVRPDWRDTHSLLGYRNPLKEEYHSTPLLRFLLMAQQDFLGEAPSLTDFLATYLDEQWVQGWYEKYKNTTSNFAIQEPAEWIQGEVIGSATQSKLFRKPGNWTDADLNLLWHKKDNGVANVGLAPQLKADGDVLRRASDVLSDRSSKPGIRYLTALQILRDSTGVNHFARTERALATLEPPLVPPLAGVDKTNTILRALGSDLKFEPGAKAITPESLGAVWAFTTEKAGALLTSLGKVPNDPLWRGIVLWGVYLWASESTSASTERTLPYFVILDEMNLARVEYYFADFLSAMESELGADGAHSAPITLHGGGVVKDQDGRVIPDVLRLPPSVYFVGTVNVDESTFSFSPKVLDRAFTMEFGDVDLNDYPLPEGSDTPAQPFALPEDFSRGGRFAGVDKRDVRAQAMHDPEVVNQLRDLHELLRDSGLGFGYRAFDEIMQFLSALESSPLRSGLPRDPQDEAFDMAVCMKVLPKFHGPYRFLAPTLEAVVAWAQERGLDTTSRKVKEMQRRGQVHGHVSYF